MLFTESSDGRAICAVRESTTCARMKTSLVSGFFLHYGDLADGTTLRRIFAAAKPDEFYHLAAVSLAP
jgi:GDP-D-mannose dehydratase